MVFSWVCPLRIEPCLRFLLGYAVDTQNLGNHKGCPYKIHARPKELQFRMILLHKF